jgi:hypothetical protein
MFLRELQCGILRSDVATGFNLRHPFCGCLRCGLRAIYPAGLKRISSLKWDKIETGGSPRIQSS